MTRSGSSVTRRLAIVGDSGEVHVGRHLLRSARDLGIDTVFCDVREAFAAPRIARVLNWRLRGHRPPYLGTFSRHVVAVCRRERPTAIVTTGLAPLDERAIRELGELGVTRLSFLTDDPFNPAHQAPWFLAGLAGYDWVFSPRRSNLDDLRRAGCRRTNYLPFGYAPDIHFSEPPSSPEEWERYRSDVVFIGGADADRVEWVAPLIESGLRVSLYGGYWDRYPATRPAARGFADSAVVRKAVGGAAVALCLVRQANRDGHSMRSVELPAIGACIVAEDTAEHRELFGEAGVAVEFARTPSDAVARVQTLRGPDAAPERLRDAAHALIVNGGHTWGDRLTTMLAVMN